MIVTNWIWQDFMPKLKAHLLPRLRKEAGDQAFEFIQQGLGQIPQGPEAEVNEDIAFKYNHIYLHNVMQINYIKECPGWESISGSFNPIDIGGWSDQVYVKQTEVSFTAKNFYVLSVTATLLSSPMPWYCLQAYQCWGARSLCVLLMGRLHWHIS